MGASAKWAAIDFVTGNHANVLEPGELLRNIHLPARALCKRFASHRSSLTHLGRSAVFLCPLSVSIHHNNLARDAAQDAGQETGRTDGAGADDSDFQAARPLQSVGAGQVAPAQRARGPHQKVCPQTRVQ